MQVGRNKYAIHTDSVAVSMGDKKIHDFYYNTFNGLIDDLKIYERSLSNQELKDSYEAIAVDMYGGNLPEPTLIPDPRILMADKYRTQYHLQPNSHWTNEPHAPIFFEGQYHIFNQYNQHGPFWHNMHWGHFVSDDMIHWRELKPALAPEKGSHENPVDDLDPDGCWSGSSVLKEQEDGTKLPVLIYTAGNNLRSNSENGGYVNCTIAYAESDYYDDYDSDLTSWIKHPDPVIKLEDYNTPGINTQEFRDPYVWKEEINGAAKYFVIVASGKTNQEGAAALLFSSSDLKNWQYEKVFYDVDAGQTLNGVDFRDAGEEWEMMVFLPLDKEAGKYIFLALPAWRNKNQVNPDCWDPHVKYTYYWIGDWDPTTMTFTPKNEAGLEDHTPRKFDAGQYFTGPSGFVDIGLDQIEGTSDDRSIVFSITQAALRPYDLRNQGYAFNSGLPTELFLRPGTNYQLGVRPIQEVEALRQITDLEGNGILNLANVSMAQANNAIASGDVKGDMLEIQVELDPGNATKFGMKLRMSNDGQEETILYYDKADGQLKIDRTKSTTRPCDDHSLPTHSLWFNAKDDAGQEVFLGADENLKLHIFLDKSQIEAYMNETKLLTSRVYPVSPALNLEVYGNTSDVQVESLKIWKMNPIYETTAAPTPNPSEWSIEPTADGSATSISMRAVTAASNDGTVQYFFEETSNRSGATDSGWISDSSYTDDGLRPGTTYTYKVKTRVVDDPSSEGEYSTAISATTEDDPSFFSAGNLDPPAPYTATNYNEERRNQFHFSSPQGWHNDVNGPLYYNGSYHLFFQHNPLSFSDWTAAMHWGHATSKDLVHWSIEPVALSRPARYPGDVSYEGWSQIKSRLFSGGGVVDVNNTSGLKEGGDDVIALFTGMVNRNDTPVNNYDNAIHMCYSTDGGATFKDYLYINVPCPDEVKERRDPKVFWYEPENKWIMIVYELADSGKRAAFYSSSNLINWTFESMYDAFPVYECTDLFEIELLNADGTRKSPQETRWVMYDASFIYQVGTFERRNGVLCFYSPMGSNTLKMESAPTGFRNTYAALTYENMPDGKRIQQAWMGRNDGRPGDGQWQGCFTFPVELKLKDFGNNNLRVTRTPISNSDGDEYDYGIEKLYQDGTTWEAQTVSSGTNPFENTYGLHYELKAEFDLTGCTADSFGLSLRSGLATVIYDVNAQTLNGIPMPPDHNNHVKIQVLVDRDALDYFGNDGYVSYQGNQPFPNNMGSQGIDLVVNDGSVELVSAEFNRLGRIWDPLDLEFPDPPPPGERIPLFENSNFEQGSLTNWIATGDAMTVQPTYGDNPAARDRESANQEGNYWIGTFEKYDGVTGEPGGIRTDAPTGTLTSTSFTITTNYLYFRVGGGNNADEVGVKLLLSGGQEEFLATGSESETMREVYADVSTYIGQTAQIVIYDNATGTWGHINADNFCKIVQGSHIPPVANAGDDVHIKLPTDTVALAGSATDADGTVEFVLWSQESGPSDASLSGENTTTLTASSLQEGIYVFKLVATDNDGLTDDDTVTVAVTANQAPVANAGPDKTITLPNTTVTLTGSGTDSDGTIVDYTWSQESGPSNASLSGADTKTLIASNLQEGTYVFELVVTDNDGILSAPDTVNVTVQSGQQNNPPVVDAGEDQIVTLPTAVSTLYGSATDSDGTIESVLWTQESGPSTATLLRESTETLTAINLVQGTYVFKLTAIDDDGDEGSSTATVIVREEENKIPVAEAGPDLEVTFPNTSVTIYGDGTDEDGTIVSYQWEQTGGAAVELSGENTKTLIVSELVAGEYLFTLTVTDNEGAQDEDEVAVIVKGKTVVYDFETGDLSRWTVVSGEAFCDENVADDESTWSGPFEKDDTYFFWGYKATGDAEVGEMHSKDDFVLGGDGVITLKISGGYNVAHKEENLYLALVNVESGEEIKIVPDDFDSETLVEKQLDGSQFIGQKCYIKVYDNTRDDWGHINFDTISVPVSNNEAPIADAGEDKSVILPQNTVVINGNAYDEDGTVVSYIWSQVSGPSSATLSGEDTETLTASDLVKGEYIFELSVADNEDAIGTDRVVVTVDDQNPDFLVYDFETGDLSRWNIISGNAFTDESVVNDSETWSGPFNKDGEYFLWGFKPNGDSEKGEMRTDEFLLGGDGQITLKIGGGFDINQVYLAVVNAETLEEIRIAGDNNDSEVLVEHTINAYSFIGQRCYIKVVDNQSDNWGHINLDTITIPVGPIVPVRELANHSFENGNLSGWTVVEGDAFSDGDVCDDTDWGWGGPFNQDGIFHLWGFKDGGDDGPVNGTGTLKSETFVLAGDGKIDFLKSGGDDYANLYVALIHIRADGSEEEIERITGHNGEGYRRVYWDASDFIGEEMYIKVVDDVTGDFGHINIDDVNVPVRDE